MKYFSLWETFNSSENDIFIAYHGTNDKFDIFNDNKPIFFVKDEEIAKTYGNIIIKAELKIENPIILDFNDKSTYFFIDKWYLPSDLAIKIKEISDDIENHYILSDTIKDELEALDFDDMYDLDGIIMLNINDSLDGVFSDYKSSTNYVVFNKKQIKLI